jgi:hypothetical protein
MFKSIVRAIARVIGEKRVITPNFDIDIISYSPNWLGCLLGITPRKTIRFVPRHNKPWMLLEQTHGYGPWRFENNDPEYPAGQNLACRKEYKITGKGETLHSANAYMVFSSDPRPGALCVETHKRLNNQPFILYTMITGEGLEVNRGQVNKAA